MTESELAMKERLLGEYGEVYEKRKALFAKRQEAARQVYLNGGQGMDEGRTIVECTDAILDLDEDLTVVAADLALIGVVV